MEQRAPMKSRGARIRSIAKDWLPPVLLKGLGTVRDRSRWGPGAREWEYLPAGWPPDSHGGWDDASIARTQLARWPG